MTAMTALRSIPLCFPPPPLPGGDSPSSAACRSSLSPLCSCRFEEDTLQGCSRFSPAQSTLFPHLSGASQRRTQVVYARRKSSTLPTETSEALDPDIAVGLNEISTEALKVMLGEDIQQLMRFKDKVDVYGEYLVEEKQLEPAKFMMVIRGMLDHQVVPEATDLQGPYKKAFEKIWGVVEDSGWLLTQPGAEGGEVEMVDDELIPPVLVYKY